MALNCNCPPSASLPDIPLSDCPEEFGQIQKLIFQRIKKDDGSANTIADPTVLATWTPLLAAADGTKVVQSPIIANPTSTPGAARTYGGDNTTPGGVTLYTGSEESTLTYEILRSAQETIKAMDDLACENFGIYLVDQFGRMGMLSDGEATPTYSPVPVSAYFAGDKMFGGLAEPDKNAVEMRFAPLIMRDFVIITPTDFNALTDLVTP